MFKRSSRVAVMLTFLLAFVASGCNGEDTSSSQGSDAASAGSSTASQGSHLDAVLDQEYVRVCTTGDYEPFTSYDSETEDYEGIDMDMARDLAEEFGVEPRFVQTSWPTLMEDFAADKCDIAMGGISVDLDRQQQAFYSIPYTEDGKTPITTCENVDNFRTLEQIDQSETRVIVNPGGTNEDFVQENLTDAEIILYEDNVTIFDQVADGEADLMITDAIEAVYQDNLHPELCAVNPDEPFTYSEKAYLLPVGDVAWKAWVDQWLHLAKENGKFDDIYEEGINAT